MPSSPRARAARTAPDKKQGSIGALESLLEKLQLWLRRHAPALPLCRSGQHIWLSSEDRSKCCNGYRRARIYLTVNARGVRRNYWREINSTDDKPFSWEAPPTNRSSRLVVRGLDAPSQAQGDDHVNVTFQQLHQRFGKNPSEYSRPYNAAPLSLVDAHMSAGGVRL